MHLLTNHQTTDYRARYYNPQTGRFLSEDPIGLRGGINEYAYVGDDPIDWIDPFGLDKKNPCTGPNCTDFKPLFCAGDALKNNGVALGLDAAGFIPGESQLAAAAQTGVAAASFANSLSHADAYGAGSAYVGGVLTGVGTLAKQTGFSWAKAVPIAGYFFNGLGTAHDLWNTYEDYQSCMAGTKYD